MRFNKQSGNMLFILLICIALLGGLAALMTRSSGSSDDTGSAEQASIAASKILQEAASLKTAVQSLLARGCSENQLNFHDARLSHNDFVNPQAASGNSCDVYHAAGAGLRYWIFPQSYYHSTTTPYASALEYHTDVNASYNVAGTPTTMSDLVWNVYSLRKEICIEINRKLGISLESNGEPSPESYGAWWKYYDGTFRNDADGIGNVPSAKHAGYKAGCFLSTDYTAYMFYYVLIEK